jgi:hypothetical protein
MIQNIIPDECVTCYRHAKSSDPSPADEANKENWEHAGEVVDIHKILQTLDRDMEADVAGELAVAVWVGRV